MQRGDLRSALQQGRFVVAPGVHDMITAVIANNIGFEFIYASGYWLTASCHGLPDAGIATYTQMLERVQTLVRVADAAVIADADTGYGGLLNVHHTVRGYESAGVVAVQIEDQEFPKKCGHTPFKRCIPETDMVEKIKVACAARQFSAKTLIIARTDARQVEGFGGALRRANAYAAAGADVIFVEALENEAEMREACRLISKPMLANMADGGRTPIRSASELQDIGYRIAIFPATTGLAAAAAVDRALRTLKTGGTSLSRDLPLFNFDDFNRLIGFEEVWAFEKNWARDETAASATNAPAPSPSAAPQR